MRRAPAALLATLLAAFAAPTLAQAPPPDRPALLPSREASVLYRLTKAGAGSTEVRITTRAGGSPIRIDLPDLTYMLVDQAARSVAMVVPEEEVVLELPFENGPQTQFQLNSRMRFTRRNADVVAGVRCTTWDVLLDKARGVVCVSEDGVLLRSSGQDEAGRRNLIEAISVSYTPAPADEFVPPAGFDRMVGTPNGPAPANPP